MRLQGAWINSSRSSGLRADWLNLRLAEVSEIDAGGTPSRSRPDYWNGSIPWMASGEIHQRRVLTTTETITEAGLVNSNAKVFPPGTVMIALNGQGRTRGRVAILEVSAACNQSLAGLRPRREIVEPHYLLHALDNAYEALRSLTGTGRSGLNLGLLRGYRLSVPPREEQRAIAAILDAIDEAVARTATAIAATESLRRALLNELLTRGIRDRHTMWKSVPGLGTVPACWHVSSLGDVARFRSGQGARGSELRPQSDRNRYAVFGGNGIAGYWPEPLVGQRVVVIGRVGQKCGAVQTTDGPAWITDNAMYNHTIQDGVSVDFLALVAQRARLNGIRNRNDLPMITQEIVHRVSVALPPPAEQDAITSVLGTCDNAIASARHALAAMVTAKEAVADALLSGRVSTSENPPLVVSG